MKIAITGGTAGIGQALGDVYESRGHEIVRLSRRNGYNIRSTPKVADAIESCDVFINNAQSGFAQTDLLFEMCQRWSGTGKTIMVISTIMTQVPVSSGIDMDLYRIQKSALEESVQQLRFRDPKTNIILVRPGNIATSTDKTVPPAADATAWANTLADIIDLAIKNNMTILDISLGPMGTK